MLQEIIRLRPGYLRILATIILTAATPLVAMAATVMTDLADYPPGSLVWITGDGFSAWESVTVQVTRLDDNPGAAAENDPWSVYANGTGGFLTSWQVPFDGYVWEVLLVSAFGHTSQVGATTTFTDAPGVNLDQMRNGSAASPNSPIAFVNGNAGSSNAHLNERWSQAYRAVFTGFTAGDTIEFTIGYDVTHSSHHAIDYLTYYDRINDPSHNALYNHGQEVINPLVGLPALAGPVYAAIPPPPASACSLVVPNPPGPAQSQPCTSFDNLDNDPTQVRMSLWGGTWYPSSPVTYVSGGDPTLSQSEARVKIKFVASGATILAAWGGHLAWNGDWGDGNSAGGISGSPYHMRAIGMTINGVPKSVGNQDRSMSADVVAPCQIDLVCPPNVTLDCDESTDTSNTGVATYTSSGQCNGITLTYSDVSSGAGCPLVITRMWRANGSGAIDSCPQIITVDDNTPPTITCPAATSPIACPASPVFPAPGASDNCGAPAVTFDDDTTRGSCPQEYSVTRTWTATDACGNTATCSQTVSVEDNTPPSFPNGCGANGNYQCASQVPAASTAGVTATDACDQSVTITVNRTSNGGSGCVSSPLIFTDTYTATDDCGNSATCSKTHAVIDNTPPTITCAAAASPIACPGTPVFPAPSASDNCGDPTVTFNDVRTPGACDAEYSVTRTWTATDACGNTASCSQTVVVEDNTPPSFSGGCGANGNYQCPSQVPAASTAGVSATDACDESVTITVNRTSNGGSGCANSPLVFTDTYTATDDCGNSSTCSKTQTVIDNTPPTITCPAAVSPVACPGTPVFPPPSASDNCDSEPAVTFNDVRTPGNCPQEYSVTRTWTATDDCGNSASCSQTVSVEDNLPPTLSGCEPLFYECDDLPAEWPEPSASDNCDGSVDVSLVSTGDTTQNGCPQRYSFVLTWEARDDCGNTSRCQQTVNVGDETRPTVICAPDTTVYCDQEDQDCLAGKSGTQKLFEKHLCDYRVIDTAYDNCDASVDVFMHLAYHYEKCPQYIRAKVWAVDDCGLISDTCLWTVYIEDTTKPVITCPQNLFFECDAVQGEWGWPTATDECDSTVVITQVDQDTAQEGCARVITRSFLAEDDCGNQSRCAQTITIGDTRPPTCQLPPSQTIFHCFGETQVCLPVSATDACDPSVTCVVTAGYGSIVNGQWCYTPEESGTYPVTVECRDDCNNVCSGSFTITIIQNSAPVCNAPVDTTIYLCDPGTISRPFSASDVDNNFDGCEIVSGPGTLTPVGPGVYTWRYNATVDEKVCVTVRCVDECEFICTATFCVTIDITEPPVCYQTQDAFFPQCDPAEVCLQVDFPTQSSGGGSDVVGSSSSKGSKGRKGGSRQQGSNLTAPANPVSSNKGPVAPCTIQSGPGYLNGGLWCWTPPDADTTVTVVIQCEDSCGHTCQNEFNVRFDLNEDPVCSLGVDLVDPPCTPEIDFVPLGSRDPEGGEVDCYLVGPGTLVPGGWQYANPVPGTSVYVKIVCSDVCDDSCIIEFDRNYPNPQPGECNVPNDTSVFLCAPTLLSWPVSGEEGTVCRVSSGPGFVEGGNWTYTADHDTSFCVTISCQSLCFTCETEFCVTIELNDPPVCQLPNDTSIVQCESKEVCLPLGALDPNGNFSHCDFDYSKTGQVGEIRDGMWCYEPSGDETHTISILCYDSCEASCRGEFTVTFDVNQPPVCGDVADTSIFLCQPREICLPVGAQDSDGNLENCAVIAGPGVVGEGFWCFTPDASGVYDVTIRCDDTCGAFCDESFSVNVTINQAPVIDLGVNLSGPQEPSGGTICFTYTVTDPNGLAGLIESLISGPTGTTIDTANNEICVPSTLPGKFEVVASVADGCGASDVDSVLIQIAATTPPNCVMPPDTSFYLCTPSQICRPVSAFSVNPPVTCEVTSGPGVVAGGNWCYTPTGSGPLEVTITCTDAVGNECDGSFSVGVTINAPPQCRLPRDTSLVTCQPGGTVCVPFTVSDPDNNLIGCQLLTNKGYLSGNQWCVSIGYDEEYPVIIRCYDACGAECRDTMLVIADVNDPPGFYEPNDTTITVCDNHPICIPLTFVDGNRNLATVAQVGGSGQLVLGADTMWCWTPPYGTTTTTVSIRAADACGAQRTENFTVTAIKPQNPSCALPPNQTYRVCQAGQVCLPIQNGNPLGVTCTLVDGLGSISGNQWCYNLTSDKTLAIRVRCTNACGAVCEQQRVYTFLIRPGDCGGTAAVGGGETDKSVLSGDVDGSGEVNIADVSILTQIVNQMKAKPTKPGARVTTADANYISRADVNCDGVINDRDVADLTAYVFDAGAQPCATK